MSTAKKGGSRPEDNCEIKEKVLVLQVEKVVFEVLVNGHGPGRTYLPKARHARSSEEPQSRTTGVAVCDERHFWPGADKAHVAGQHVEELRKFVDAESPEEAPNARNPGIVAG